MPGATEHSATKARGLSRRIAGSENQAIRVVGQKAAYALSALCDCLQRATAMPTSAALRGSVLDNIYVIGLSAPGISGGGDRGRITARSNNDRPGVCSHFASPGSLARAERRSNLLPPFQDYRRLRAEYI